MRAEAYRDIVGGGEAREDAGDLEGAREAGAGKVMPIAAGELAAIEDDAPGVGQDDAGEAIRARGLARAAGADEGEDLPLLGGERHRIERDAPAEALGEPHHLEDAHQATIAVSRLAQRAGGYRSQKPAADSMCSTTSIQTPAGSKRPKRRCPKGSSRRA